MENIGEQRDNEARPSLERIVVSSPGWLQDSVPDPRTEHHYGRSEVTATPYGRQRL